MRAFVGLGGNIGHVVGHFGMALRALSATGNALVALSALYQTEALRPPGSDADVAPYWNAVCSIDTDLEPEVLLRLLQKIEHQAGRPQARLRWAARCLDLDLLLYGAQIQHTPFLTLPHPGLLQRAFVLRPLCDVAPEQLIPSVGQTVAVCLANLPNPDAGILAVHASWYPKKDLSGARQQVVLGGQCVRS